MSSEYFPTDEDITGGQDSYLRYLAGLAMLCAPSSQVAAGLRGEGIELDPLRVIVHAERLMYASLQDVIRFAHPQEDRSSIGALEPKYAAASPHLKRIVRTTYIDQREEIGEFEPLTSALRVYKPNPVADEHVYKYLCHSRRDKLHTRTLLAEFHPARQFASLLTDRFLNDVIEGENTPAVTPDSDS